MVIPGGRELVFDFSSATLRSGSRVPLGVFGQESCGNTAVEKGLRGLKGLERELCGLD